MYYSCELQTMSEQNAQRAGSRCCSCNTPGVSPTVKFPMCAKRNYKQDVADLTIKHGNFACTKRVTITICRLELVSQQRPFFYLCVAIMFCFAGVR